MPPTLGQRLRQAREARQLSPEDIAFRIKIPPARVRDLEEDAYTAFGSLTYARSFLKSYAEFLGVEASDVIGHLQSPPLGGACDYRYLLEDLGPWVDSNESRQSSSTQRVPMQSPRSLLIGMVVLMFALLASVGVLIANSSFFRPKTAVREETRPALVEKAHVESPAPSVNLANDQPLRPARPLMVPDKNAPPPRAEIVN